jgi:hypothetical protein
MNKMEKEKKEKLEEKKIVKRNLKKTEEESLSIQDQVVVTNTENKITITTIF